MQQVSTRLFVIPLGDSKINVFQLSDSEKYTLLVQSIDSQELAIVGKEENGEFKIHSENGEITEPPIIIDSVTDKQLLEFGNMLVEKFHKDE